MIKMTLAELARILGTECSNPDVIFTGLSKDNRRDTLGTLYVALKGEQFDGHDFVKDACEKGAAAALVSRHIDDNIPQIIVPDTLLALGTLAKNWRNRFSLPLIGVTGSNGKTTSKNMIAAILTAACQGNNAKVLATQGNLNNTIGLPFTLVNLNEQHRYGVIEMGMNIPGEISYLTDITKPQAALITNAAEAHLKGVQDVAGVAREKGIIFSGLPATGTAVLNRDDAFYEYWRTLVTGHTIISFGLQPGADVSAVIHDTSSTTHQYITLQTPDGQVDINLALIGKHNIRNAVGAAAAAYAIGIDLAAIKTGLENTRPEQGRITPHLLSNGARVIDDTYNANPFSTHAAINTLATYSGKKILVLGDMRELGPEEIALHKLTGERALTAGIDYLFTLGNLTAETTKAFGKNAAHFTDRNQLIKALQPYLQDGTTVLVKGSRSMHMELIIAELLPDGAVTAH
ncbi:MAG: UDP-N-acetylmuramoyl-tripeptide--D-alanyl-D-alanine ligase [Pseudomonadota bacterium]